MELFKKFFNLTRGYTILMTLASCLLVYPYANKSESFSLPVFLILVITLCLLHMAANLYDDYKDVQAKLSQGIPLENIHFEGFISKAALILNKTFSLKQVRLILNILFIIAFSVGICFVFRSGFPVLLFILAGAFLILFYPYSARFCLSEVIVGLIWGPLMIMGGYYAMCGYINEDLATLSFVVFFTTVVLLHVNNIMDWEFDENNGKKTLALVSKTKDNAIKLLVTFISLPYLIVVCGVILSKFNPYTLLVFLTLPIACKLISSMKDYIAVKNVEFKPRWYWGFFENWKDIQEQRLDFLMFRMYLARNLSFFFALLLSIGLIIG